MILKCIFVLDSAQLFSASVEERTLDGQTPVQNSLLRARDHPMRVMPVLRTLDC